MAGHDRQWQGINNLQEYSLASGSNGRGNGSGSGSTPGMPARPARSVRRPARDSGGALPEQSTHRQQLEAPRPPNMRKAGSNDSSAGAGATRAGRLAQAIQREEREREASSGLRPGSSLSFRSASPDADEADFFGGEPLIVPKASTSTAPRKGSGSPALEKAVAAFSTAGQTKGRNNARERAGTNASSRSADRAAAAASAAKADGAAGASRSRRGAVGVQGESARFRATMQPQAGVPSTPAFREMERVLGQVTTDWPELLPPPDGEDTGEEEEVQDTFDPVTLALSLVDPDAPPERYRSFLAHKAALSRSLESSIKTHYRAFDSSASSYNGLVTNLSHAQKNTTDLRKVLEGVRETLGKRRNDLAVLEARRTELAEMDRILVTIETLKGIPDRLEALISDKQFLQAASLLMRSLKMINRGDMLEVTATADLRSYLQSQENLMFEYLTEELHSHLYLKSLYTESRWKPYSPQQNELPVILQEIVSRSIFDLDNNSSSSHSEEKGNNRPTKMAAFLRQLSQKGTFTKNIDETIEEADAPEASTSKAPEHTSEGASSSGIPKSGSLASVHSVAAGGNGTNGTGRSALRNGTGGKAKHDPEQDSFTYIESILESLAYLGRLGVAIDSVLQRNPLEIYNLVEGTVVEVDERNDPIRRSSMRTAGFANSPKLFLNGTNPSQNSTAYSLLVRSSMSASTLPTEDANTNSGMLDMNTDLLLDFFWTLFSKLDAVLQGFRVFHEVVQRIVKSRDFQESALVSKNGGLIFTLNDVWRPIQIEVQVLLHDYLVDEHDGNVTSRSPVASVNDVLRQGRAARDPRKSLFKFGESDSKATSKRIKAHEDSLNRALKVAVPGLVSSLAEGSSAAVGLSSNSTAFASKLDSTSLDGMANGPSSLVGRTHRMLVPPNAFRVDSLALPALKFLERVAQSVPEAAGGAGGAQSADIGRRCSGLMDEITLEKLRPALNLQLSTLSNGTTSPDPQPGPVYNDTMTNITTTVPNGISNNQEGSAPSSIVSP